MFFEICRATVHKHNFDHPIFPATEIPEIPTKKHA